MIFKVRPGRYTVPNFGHLDTRNEVSDERYLELYENPAFPWIEPTDQKNTLAFLKKQKMSVKRISNLILKAKSPEEIEMLMKLNDSRTLKNLAETRLAAFM
ncbi:hypothetical protein LCGC14_1786420, partial [marine sediment metagenome]|uniref:Uncharacterized protein n=2 Tax=root TaxID=1 RepID=A0A831QML2_9FLAO|nr:hypothetical protein [Pricia antarctica]